MLLLGHKQTKYQVQTKVGQEKIDVLTTNYYYCEFLILNDTFYLYDNQHYKKVLTVGEI